MDVEVITSGAGTGLPCDTTVILVGVAISVSVWLVPVSPPGRYSATVPLTSTESPGTTVNGTAFV
jgi:hypothetical protein